MAQKQTKTNANVDALSTPKLEVKAIYLKDSSFESPNSPHCFENPEQPKIDVGVNLNANHIQEDLFEMVLHIEVHANVGDKPLFLVSLDYAGVFETVDCDNEEERQELLLVEAPMQLFPYVRQMVSNLTREGGFPAMTLTPINFREVYLQKKAKGEVEVSGEFAKKQAVN